MKPGTFIIIVLLGIIAYALLRQPPGSVHGPSGNSVEQLLKLAQQFIPPPQKSDDREPPPTAQDTARDNVRDSENAPPFRQPGQIPNASSRPEDGRPISSSGGSSGGSPQLTWDPSTKGDGELIQYTGVVRQHMEADCLLVRCGTRARPDAAVQGDCVLAGFPGAANVAVDSTIEFYAYSGGAVTSESNTETKTMTVLIYADGARPGQSNRAEPPAPKQAPGSWMWDRHGSLDRAPYDQR